VDVDFLAIGHVTLDQTPTGTRPGGAAYYAALTARRRGLSVALLTSFGPDFPVDALPAEIQVVNVSSDRTTTFAFGDSRAGRQLTLLSRAADLQQHDLVDEWRQAPLVLLCPVANEVDRALAGSFADAALGVLPQGWMRQRGARGVITPELWDEPEVVLPQAQLLVVSAEEIQPFEKEAIEWFQHVPLGALTLGAQGAILFVNGDQYRVEADPAVEVDDTGAGDVFAATMLIEYDREGNAWDAAAAAACAAAASVEARGAEGIPDRPTLERRLQGYRRRQGR